MNRLIRGMVVTAIPLLLPGCGWLMTSAPEKSGFLPFRNGFGFVNVSSGFEVGPRCEIHYQFPDGKHVLIWPYVEEPGATQVHEDCAVFIGYRMMTDRFYVNDLGNRMHPLEMRLFLFKAPASLSDITDEAVRVAGRHTPLAQKLAEDRLGYKPLNLTSTASGAVAVWGSAGGYRPIYKGGVTIELSWEELEGLIPKAEKLPIPTPPR
jgi:hypothetical protein